jgi:alkanesulfonate monooxygenase SsuD/methylene tetrahydromethanopterin reductase-like flavin-dependent oxidoreductase (luciferase family)
LGLGWSEDEYEATNASFKNRGEHFDEFLKCLNALWTKEEPEFQGKFYQISRSKVYPKPVQKPRPPLTIGGFGPRALKRAVTLADGYNGILMPFNQMSELLTGFKDAAEASGRSLFELQVVCRGNLNLLDHSPGSHRYPLVGTEREVKDDLKRYEEMGVTEIFFDLNFESGAILDKLFRTMEHLHPNL